MKFSAVLSALALVAPGVLASPTQRDLATIQGVITDIQSQVNSLQTAIEANPLDADAIVAQSDTLVSTINDGATTVDAQAALTQIEALGLVSPIQDLAADVDTTVQALVGRKDEIDALNEGCTTLESLQAQAAAAQKLADSLIAKVPEALKDISTELAATISNAIQKGVDAYAGECDNTEPTSTTTTTTSEPTSTTTTSEPTSTTTSSTRTACPAPTN
ncbi:hydrophobic surface binding protein A-domain-containing protein [Aspergillus pseudoustus]|uniref:Hydrophobic surface binding protein A-domain-containing protein n=1 Tax=Aspergillus pseudoustus TaxID=1810923 RepID=A0ABR4IRE1_9EURO